LAAVSPTRECVRLSKPDRSSACFPKT
jgi:hypothetical protein